MSEIQVKEGVSEIPREQWNALVGESSPFLEWEWLASLEEAGCVGGRTGWIPRPAVAYRDGRLIAACPIYIKLNSEGEFVYDWSWAGAAERAGIAYYPKVLVGVPFTPVSGSRVLVASDEDADLWRRRFAFFLRELCGPNDLSGVHVNFCREHELERFEKAGFLTRIGFQYHWLNEGYESFEEYLQRFRSKRRNQIRRERRELEEHGIRMECVSGDQIDEATIDHVYRFYVSTINHHHYGSQYLNRDFFQLMYERYRSRLVFSLAKQGDETIAGTFNVVKGDALYGRYWGADRAVRHLHFNACYYSPVEYCIEHGLSRFEPGAGGEYKQLRGFDAQPTFSAHYLADPQLRQAIDDFLVQERRDADHTIEWIRERSALKKRPDASPD